MSNESDSEPKFAVIKFDGDSRNKAGTTVPVNQIEEFIKRPPKHRDDYEKDKLYTYLHLDEKTDEITQYVIQIGKLMGKCYKCRITVNKLNEDFACFLPIVSL